MALRHLVVIAFGLLAMGFSCENRPDGKKGFTAVNIRFGQEDFPAKMKVFEMADDVRLKPWVTGTVKNPKDLPVGPEIEDGLVYLKPGGIKRVVLSMHNPTDKDLYFFAAPHAFNPAKLSLGFEFRCLCLNHAYHAPPRQYWYRVVEMKLDAGYRGDAVEVKHELSKVDKKRAAAMQIPAAVVDPPATGNAH